ncbi:MAG: hypothetical protein IJ740_13950 [Ruminococcus sp.]|nr:hypothetical protein [Ruminococcus sp.]
MGKQIKKEKMSSAEKLYRVLGTVLFIYTVAIAGIGAVFFKKMTDSEDTKLAVMMSVLFFVYFVFAAMQAVLAFRFYKKSDLIAGVGHGIVMSAVSIINIVNLRFFLVLFFVGLGKDDTAKKLIGDVSTAEYTSSLSGTWTALLVGMVIAMVMGVLCVVRLVSKMGDK